MRIVIRARGLWVDKSLRAHVRDRLGVALGFTPRISSARVYLAALKSPRGDLGCRIVVKLTRSRRRLIVTGRHPDFFALVDRVTRHAGSAVRRHLERRKDRRRRHGRRLLTTAA
jgi:ribosome-associated translation inhibitor RaiA